MCKIGLEKIVCPVWASSPKGVFPFQAGSWRLCGQARAAIANSKKGPPKNQKLISHLSDRGEIVLLIFFDLCCFVVDISIPEHVRQAALILSFWVLWFPYVNSMPLSFSVLCLEQLLGSNLGKDKKVILLPPEVPVISSIKEPHEQNCDTICTCLSSISQVWWPQAHLLPQAGRLHFLAMLLDCEGQAINTEAPLQLSLIHI